MDKSYVTLEQQVCVVCTRQFDTGSLLLDKRLANRFDKHTVTGWGMCPDCTAKIDEGYVALVECDPTKSNIVNDRTKPEDAYRTGRIAFMREHAFEQVFDLPLTKNKVFFIEPEAFNHLQTLVPPS